MEQWSIVFVTVGVSVVINLLMFMSAYGKMTGTVDGHSKLISKHDSTITHLGTQVTRIATTCAIYFGTNPNPKAAETMREVVESLEQYQPKQES